MIIVSIKLLQFELILLFKTALLRKCLALMVAVCCCGHRPTNGWTTNAFNPEGSYIAATKYLPGKSASKQPHFPKNRETLQLLLKSDTCNVAMKEDCFCVFRRKLLFFVTVNTLKGIKGFCCCCSPLPEGRWASISICITVQLCLF